MTELPQKSQLLAQFGGVPRVLERVVCGFLDSSPGHLESIREALENKNSQLVSSKAHSYKGSLGYFCQGSLYKLVKQMEELAGQDQLGDAATLYPEVREKSLVLTTHLADMVGQK